jgi:hypothetical protein
MVGPGRCKNFYWKFEAVSGGAGGFFLGEHARSKVETFTTGDTAGHRVERSEAALRRPAFEFWSENCVGSGF